MCTTQGLSREHLSVRTEAICSDVYGESVSWFVCSFIHSDIAALRTKKDTELAPPLHSLHLHSILCRVSEPNVDLKPCSLAATKTMINESEGRQ